MDKYEYLKKVFSKNNIEFKSFASSSEAKNCILNDINEGEDITIGGSMTVEEIGIYEDLCNNGNKVVWHWREDSEKEENVSKDIYMCSSNAITEDGKLVNMDGLGNRVSSMIYGYKKVFIIVGKNKISKDYKEASVRMKKVAAPLNAKRLNLKTPCVKTGACMDCDSPDRICGVESIIHRGLKGSKICVYLIDEDLGF